MVTDRVYPSDTNTEKIVVSITERLARLIESPEKKLLVFTEQDQITKSVRRGEAKRNLIIDDKLSRSVFAGILRSRGYSVVSTETVLKHFVPLERFYRI